MKPLKKPPLHDFYPFPEHKPTRTGTYRIYDGEAFTAAYFDGSEFEIEVSHWAGRSKRTF